jgi:hypothetical protein
MNDSLMEQLLHEGEGSCPPCRNACRAGPRKGCRNWPLNTTPRQHPAPRDTHEPLELFDETRAALRALDVAFESRELLAYTEGMGPLAEQEPTPAAWAMAFLREQQPVGVKAEAA